LDERLNRVIASVYIDSLVAVLKYFIFVEMNNKQTDTISMPKIFLLFIALALLFKANAQDWKWVNPTPTGNQLNFVKYLDAKNVIAVGNYGTILISNNGGQNWKQLNSHTNANLLSISAIDKDTIYVSGQDLSLLKTTDGGNNWITLREGSYGSRNTSKVLFVNSKVGFLLGDGMEEFFKTTDSGKTWIKQQVDYNFQGVTSLFFASADTGYASIGYGMSGTVLKTTDGGETWVTKNIPINWPLNSLVFTDKQTGYMVGNMGNILKTEDAGETWQILNEFPSNLTNNNLISVDFINQKIGFIVGSTEILKTTDCGKHWEVIAHSAFDLRSVSFIDSIHGICVGGDWLHDFSGIITTSNGGMNWNERSLTITDRYISKIKFLNEDTGYIVGGNTGTYSGFIFKTTDEGNTWLAINTGIDNYWISDLSLPDDNTIYLVGQSGQILKSNDAGLSWQKQNSNTSENLNDVFFLNSNTGYVVGDNQTILKTTNGGNTWIRQVSPQTQHLYSVYFKDLNEGYIASHDWEVDSCTVLLTTTDGGVNWKKRSIGGVRAPMEMTFINHDTAFIAGDFGGILKTTNGGKNWEASYHNGNTYLDIFFTNENIGYVIGEDGEISMTENCGKDWIVLDSGTDKDLMSICFTNINTGFAVGSGGIILKTTNGGSRLKALQQPYYSKCPGDSVTLYPNFIGGSKPLSFKWDKIGASHSITVSPDSTTNYLVTITDQEMDTIQVNLRVEANYAPTPVISQQGDTLISNIKYGNQWYCNDTLVPYFYSNIYVPKISGNFYSIANNYGCYSEKSNIIQLIIRDSNQFCDNEITLYPNPVKSNLTLLFPANYDRVELILFDKNGKLITKKTVSGNTAQLNISDLTHGIYFIQIVSNDQVTTKKIIKK
jgi:photosystem II stability/assembly factor-like uncharacterized protein